jgi:hypothetical protein
VPVRHSNAVHAVWSRRATAGTRFLFRTPALRKKRPSRAIA